MKIRTFLLLIIILSVITILCYIGNIGPIILGSILVSIFVGFIIGRYDYFHEDVEDLLFDSLDDYQFEEFIDFFDINFPQCELVGLRWLNSNVLDYEIKLNGKIIRDTFTFKSKGDIIPHYD